MAQLNELLVTGSARVVDTLYAQTMIATTQSAGDNSEKVATTAYVDRAINTSVINAINSSY